MNNKGYIIFITLMALLLLSLERKKEIPYKKGKAEDIICLLSLLYILFGSFAFARARFVYDDRLGCHVFSLCFLSPRSLYKFPLSSSL